MPTSTAVKPAAASAGLDALTILGAELLLVGGLAAVIARRVPPGVILGLGAATVVTPWVLSEVLRHPVRRLTASSILALSLSFASAVPGVLFFVDLLNGSGGACYERPLFSSSGFWLFAGPGLLIVSAIVSPLRLNSVPLLIVRALHALVWLLGAGNTVLCALTV